MSPARRVLKFIGKLKHTGDYYGTPFRLRHWQKSWIVKLFGKLREDGNRQYRRAFLALPRKQGKSEVIGAIGLYLLMACGRNQRVYIASGDLKQAAIIHGIMAEMIRQDPVLERNTVIYDGFKRIYYPRMNCWLEVLSSVPKSKHGLNPTAILIDEMHVCDEALINVLSTGFGARKNPLTIMITTAGEDINSVCFEEWQYARQVRDGVIDDPQYLPVIYEADPDDDWESEETWCKAMPALEDFCSLEFIREEYKRAKARPRYEGVFKTYYLNLWTSSASSWLAIEDWNACATLTQEDVDALDHQHCFGGLDLGVVGDMSAAIFLFPNHLGGLDLLSKFWVPKDGKWRDEPKNKTLYEAWEREGNLTFTAGSTQDHGQIEDEIVEWNGRFPIQLLAADRAFATQILSRLFNHHEIQVRGIAQGPITLNEPMTKLEAMILERTLRHDRNPIMAYNVSNGKVKKGNTGLIHLDKSGATKRIDGLAAAIDGVAAYLTSNPEDARESIYEKRGLLVL